MDRWKTIGNKLAVSSSLPSEAVPIRPVVEIFGYQRVYVENHKGIAEYDRCRITVKVNYGQICIIGQNLQLAEMTKTSLVVIGIIDCVSTIRKAR